MSCNEITLKSEIKLTENYKQLANKDYIQEIGNFTLTDDACTSELEGCFEGCHNLTSFTFASASTATVLPKKFFKDCSSLTTVTLPQSITTIEESAFEGCDRLTTIENIDNIKYVNAKAFKGCVNLDLTNLIKGSTKIGEIASEAYKQCNKLINLNIASNITKIGSGAFEECENLSAVSFYEDSESSDTSLVSIGERAFYDTSISECKLPNNVVKIGASAFASCNQLETLTQMVHTYPLTISDSAFANCRKLGEINISGSTAYTDTIIYTGATITNDDENSIISCGEKWNEERLDLEENKKYKKQIKSSSI